MRSLTSPSVKRIRSSSPIIALLHFKRLPVFVLFLDFPEPFPLFYKPLDFFCTPAELADVSSATASNSLFLTTAGEVGWALIVKPLVSTGPVISVEEPVVDEFGSPVGDVGAVEAIGDEERAGEAAAS
ncbi:hypothetical protein PC128_g26882 [Phytophthora cactorum]|nr:hypothetical protein PC128_g26882 [Phytophthora cactorum]